MARPLFDDDHEAYRESFRSFIAREADGDIRTVFAKAAEHGFASMAVPEDRGGAGIEDRRFGAVVAEELGLAGHAGLGLIVATHNEVCVPALGEHAQAGRLAAFAIGSTDRVPGGMVADDLVVADGDRVFTFAIEDRTPSEEGFGLTGVGFADIEVPDDVTELDAPTWAVDQQLAIAVLALAGARHALSLTLGYVADRKAFGVPIASFQNTRYALAAVSAEIEAAQAFLDDCVLRDRTPARAAAAKLTATEIQGRAVDAGLQFHGGYGYMLEYPISSAYADARFLRLHGGTSEALKDVLAGALGM
ncbi:MAG: acyl-CoA dehydrogenase [Solirubrobacteraceae bacterium]|nr:acyl-CoA dehydrogenase [Solirubrobacteraceae bacterium]